MGRPNWFDELSDGDQRFVRSFVLESGSLKALAKLYGISYPTVRHRLDRIITKIKQTDSEADDFVRRLHNLAVDKDLPPDLTQAITAIYLDSKEETS
jgi:hypothetical protein